MRAKTRIAHFLLYGSSILKALAKLLLPRSIMVDALSVDGFYVIDGLLYYDKSICGSYMLWQIWSMPDEYLIEMNKLKAKY